MQQIRADPVLLGEANAQFREEWRRVAGDLKHTENLPRNAAND